MADGGPVPGSGPGPPLGPGSGSAPASGPSPVPPECLEGVDPRVQIELERLNNATDDINKLEVDLDEARLIFRQLLFESTFKIQSLAKKLGNCIDKSRPYYEARFKANKALQEMRATAVLYEKANSAHSAAREMVYLAEQGLCRLCEEGNVGGAGGVPLDPAWQEMLNHATSRVNQAEAERAAAGARHRITVDQHRVALSAARGLQHSLKRHVAKSRPYFEEKARYNALLDNQKNKVQTLEKEVSAVKFTYAQALRNLEKISDEIHRHRNKHSQNASSASSNETSVQGCVSQNTQTLDTPSKSALLNDNVQDNTNLTKENMSNDHKIDNVKAKNGQMSKSESIREWIKKNGATSPINDFSEDPAPPLNGELKKLAVIRPKSLPQDFSEKYSDILTPFQPNKSIVNQQNKGSESTPSTVSKNGPESDNWIEINLEYSSPEEISFEKCSNFSSLDCYKQIPYERMPADEITHEDSVSRNTSPTDEKKVKKVEFEKNLVDNANVPNSKVSADSPRRIIRNKFIGQKSLPMNSLMYQNDNESDINNQITNNSLKSKLKPDLSNWITRSSAKAEEDLQFSPTRRQSFDVILNDTGEKMKEIFSQGFMMFHISSLTERRNSEPKVPQTEKLSPNQKVPENSVDMTTRGTVSKAVRKMPSPLDKTLSYLNVCSENSTASNNSDDIGSDTDSLASVEMLTDDQIHSLMLDGQLEAACQQVLGMPGNGKLEEIVP